MFFHVYVDDSVIIDSSNEITDDASHQINKEFPLKDLCSLNPFLGMQVQRTTYSILLGQKKYISDLLAKPGLTNVDPLPTPLTGKCMTKSAMVVSLDQFTDDVLYRSTIGALQHVLYVLLARYTFYGK